MTTIFNGFTRLTSWSRLIFYCLACMSARSRI